MHALGKAARENAQVEIYQIMEELGKGKRAIEGGLKATDEANKKVEEEEVKKRTEMETEEAKKAVEMEVEEAAKAA